MKRVIGNRRTLKLFERGARVRDIDLDKFMENTPYFIADDYKRAADQLTQSVVEGNRRHDMFFWPIASLYRHAIELILKEVIQAGSKLNPKKFTPPEIVHEFEKLWPRAREVVSWFYNVTEMELKKYDAAFQEFHRIDPNGQAFRYWTNTKGKPQLTGLPRSIDLLRTAENLSELYCFLNGSLIGIEEEIWCRETNCSH